MWVFFPLSSKARGDNHPSVKAPSAKKSNYLDKLNKSIGKTVVNFSNDVDSLFGGNSKAEVINKSQLGLSWFIEKVEGQDVAHSPEVDLRLVLPRTEKTSSCC